MKLVTALARILILLTLVTMIVNAQCLTLCAVRSCSPPAGHCHQDKQAPCSHLLVESDADVHTNQADAPSIAIAPLVDAPAARPASPVALNPRVEPREFFPPLESLTILRI